MLDIRFSVSLKKSLNISNQKLFALSRSQLIRLTFLIRSNLQVFFEISDISRQAGISMNSFTHSFDNASCKRRSFQYRLSSDWPVSRMKKSIDLVYFDHSKTFEPFYHVIRLKQYFIIKFLVIFSNSVSNLKLIS